MARNLSISEKQVLQVLRDRDRETEPVLGTTDVAERTDVSPPTAKDRLDALVEEGVLKTHTYGRVPVYWPADERISSDPEPISGGLAEEVEEVAEANGEPKPAAIRRLVELGLEAEEAGIRPAEMSTRVDVLEEEAERIQEKLDRANDYYLAGALVTAGILTIMLSSVIPGSPLMALPYASTIFSGIQTVGALLAIAGFVGWVWSLIKPQLDGGLDALTSD